jgi:two-component system, NarL family, nitrate/nitrite response regulator NarL
MAATCNAACAGAWNHRYMALSMVIVDDSEPFLDSARALLVSQGVRVLAVASTPDDAVARVRQHQPDVVLLDLHFGSVSGLDLARDLTAESATPPVVVLVSTASREDVEPLLAGSAVRGFLPKVELSASAVATIVGSTCGARHP